MREEQSKLLGQYSTPESIVGFISDKVVCDGDRVLDPASGDGVFLSYLLKRYTSCALTGVEIDRRVYEIAASNLVPASRCKLINADFFDVYESLSSEPFDSIVGNPPYIRFQNFRGRDEKITRFIKKEFGVGINGECSSWVYFTFLALSLLSREGRLGFLIPREILFAKYAEGLRNCLKTRFDTEIVTLDADCFPATLQRTVALFARPSQKGSVRINYFGSSSGRARSLAESDLSNWVLDRLPPKDARFIEKIKSDSAMWNNLTDYVEVKASLVTGCKNFFVLNSAEISQHRINRRYFIECLSSPTVVTSPVFTAEDFKRAERAGEKCRLLRVTSDDLCNDAHLKKYIRLGERCGYHKRYKCRIRDPWYTFQKPAAPDAYIGHLMHKYPKFAANDAGVVVINNLHNVWLKNCSSGPAISDITTCFYNYFTLITVELLGKIYGGGNLEVNPLDCARIQLPNMGIMGEFSGLTRVYMRRRIDDALLDGVSRVVCRIMELDFKRLKAIYTKLLTLRLRDNISARYRRQT